MNLGAKFEWERVSFSVHELVYGKSAQYDNDGGVVEAYYENHPDEVIPAGTPDVDPVTGLRYMRTEIPVTPITNLEVAFKAMDTLTFTVGATNVFDEYPEQAQRHLAATRSSARRRQQRGGGLPVVLAVRHQRCVLLRQDGLYVLMGSGG